MLKELGDLVLLDQNKQLYGMIGMMQYCSESCERKRNETHQDFKAIADPKTALVLSFPMAPGIRPVKKK